METSPWISYLPDDFASANILAWTAMLLIRFFNVGSGMQTSLKQPYNILFKWTLSGLPGATDTINNVRNVRVAVNIR
jgi:hypothetical protein